VDHYEEKPERLRALFCNFVKVYPKKSFPEMRAAALIEKFVGCDPPILSQKRLEGLLYQSRALPKLDRNKELIPIVQHLWNAGVLRQPDPTWMRNRILTNLHKSLADLLDTSSESIVELEDPLLDTGGRLPGQYWIYRPSVHYPTYFVKGLLTVHPRSDEPSALSALEDYRVSGDLKTHASNFREVL
jgi:hypothetical protein